MNTITKKWSSQRFRNFQIGLLIAFAAVFMAFNWTSVPPTYIDESVIFDHTPDAEIIRTIHHSEIKKVPPTKIIPLKLDITLTDDIEYTNEPKIEHIKDAVMTDDVKFITDVPGPEPVVPPAPPIVEFIEEPEDESTKIHVRVERMPIFSDCGQFNKEAERKACSDKSMLKYVYSNIKYPPLAKENGIQGTVTVQFVIEKDGSIGDIVIARDIGGGCGEEVRRIVKLMPDWIPGQQGIHKVRVKYTLPVKFSLE